MTKLDPMARPQEWSRWHRRGEITDETRRGQLGNGPYGTLARSRMDPMARWPGAERTRWHRASWIHNGRGELDSQWQGASWIHNGPDGTDAKNVRADGTVHQKGADGTVHQKRADGTGRKERGHQKESRRAVWGFSRIPKPRRPA